jgi:hypothetical protein
LRFPILAFDSGGNRCQTPMPFRSIGISVYLLAGA